MKPNILLMNFTHVYEQERFIRNQRFQWLDCTDLNGTDCYCDEEAALKLRQRMEPFAPDGIHFIDSGNIIMSVSSGPTKSNSLFPWLSLIIIRICNLPCLKKCFHVVHG